MNSKTLDLKDTLFALLLGERNWGEFLGQLVDDCHQGEAVFILQNTRSLGGDATITLSSNSGIGFVERYASYAGANPVVNQELLQDNNRAYADPDVIARDEMHASEFYNDFLRPIGIEGSAWMSLTPQRDATVYLSTVFGNKDPEYARHMAARLDAIGPDLRRVLRHFCHVEADLSEDTLATHLLRQSDGGVCLLNDALEPRLISPAAHRMQDKHDIFRIGPTGRLQLRDPDQQLSLTRMAMRDYTGPRDIVWDKPGYRLTLLRTSRNQISDLLNGPTLALLFETNGIGQDLDSAYLRQRFGLTKAEMRVLSMINAGLSIRDMAESSTRSVETIRSQVKSLLAKTESDNQIAMLHMLHGNHSR